MSGIPPLYVNANNGMMFSAIPDANGDFSPGPPATPMIIPSGFPTDDVFSVTPTGVRYNGGNSLSGLGGTGNLPLPVLSTRATSSDIINTSNLLGMSDSLSEGSLMWQALSTMMKTAQQDEKTSMDIKQAYQEQKLMAKDKEIASKQDKLAADIKDAEDAWSTAQTTFAITCVAAVASAAATAVGGVGGAIIGGLGTIASSGAQLYQAQRNVESWESGAKRQSAEADIESVKWQKLQEQCEQNIDSAKESIDSSKEQLKLALRVLKEVEERRSQNVSAMTRV
jgi:hypothetical protein